jgi:hypothetical protein
MEWSEQPLRLWLFLPGIREGDQPEFELSEVQVGLQILLEHSENKSPELQYLAGTVFYSKILIDFR